MKRDVKYLAVEMNSPLINLGVRAVFQFCQFVLQLIATYNLQLNSDKVVDILFNNIAFQSKSDHPRVCGLRVYVVWYSNLI